MCHLQLSDISKPTFMTYTTLKFDTSIKIEFSLWVQIHMLLIKVKFDLKRSLKSYQTLSRLECKCKLWEKRGAWATQYGVTTCCSSQVRASGSPTGEKKYMPIRGYFKTITHYSCGMLQNDLPSCNFPHFCQIATKKLNGFCWDFCTRPTK